jgi:hypothetical protein
MTLLWCRIRALKDTGLASAAGVVSVAVPGVVGAWFGCGARPPHFDPASDALEREDARRTYLAAADRFSETRSLDAVVTAIDADLAQYRPGGADELVDARERVYFTAVALCDLGSTIAQKLQRTNELSVETAVPIYDRFLELTEPSCVWRRL